MIKVASEDINKNIFEQVIAEETSVIAHQIYKEERNNHFLLLTDKFYTLKKRNLFCKLVVLYLLEYNTIVTYK